MKPHALNNLGEIIDQVSDYGFEISCLRLFNLMLGQVHEFMQMYKTVWPLDYAAMCEQMSSEHGPCVAMELRTENAVGSLRKFCGHPNPTEAQRLSSSSLRA